MHSPQSPWTCSTVGKWSGVTAARGLVSARHTPRPIVALPAWRYPQPSHCSPQTSLTGRRCIWQNENPPALISRIGAGCSIHFALLGLPFQRRPASRSVVPVKITRIRLASGCLPEIASTTTRGRRWAQIAQPCTSVPVYTALCGSSTFCAQRVRTSEFSYHQAYFVCRMLFLVTVAANICGIINSI